VGILDGWRLCPRCGHQLEPTHGPHLGCPACGSSYWANSAPAVQGLLVRDATVLIGRRKIEPRKGHWDLPGGFLEEGEPALDGLKREFLEETGIEIEPLEWLGTFVDPYDAAYVLSLSWLVGGAGEPVADDDVQELAWFGPDELPAEMAFASQSVILAHWAERQARDP
jgi:ADP-ribose pyrophosphatase YjhB (NUDIX family)